VQLPRSGGGGLSLDAAEMICESRHVRTFPAVAQFGHGFFAAGRPVLDGALALTRAIRDGFEFDSTATDISTPVAEVLHKRRGVCQDFAHLALSALRALGLPARHVSGYLLTRPPPGKPKLQGPDASHAWISVWAGPEVGWVDFDPTNGLVPSNEHVVVAFGRDYEDVSPISGVLLGGGDQTITVAVDVDPR